MGRLDCRVCGADIGDEAFAWRQNVGGARARRPSGSPPNERDSCKFEEANNSVLDLGAEDIDQFRGVDTDDEEGEGGDDDGPNLEFVQMGGSEKLRLAGVHSLVVYMKLVPVVLSLSSVDLVLQRSKLRTSMEEHVRAQPA